MAVTTLASNTAAAEDKPTFVAPAYAVMQPRWKICSDVNIGTEAIRDEANLDEYFPLGGAETADERVARVKRAEFFPMFKETVKGLVGLVFRKDPQLGNDVPTPIVNLAENIDGAGTALPVFLRRVFADALTKGHSGILVDVPKVTSSRTLTIREETALGLRPYWVHIRPEQIINWRTQTINGNTVLTLLVLKETVYAASGAYGTSAVDRFRVFIRNAETGLIDYEVWTQESDTKDPELQANGTLRNVTVIPFVLVYGGERIAPLQSIPPLIDLAYTNIAHVQVLSDHRTSLHAAGNPILVIKGRVGGNPRPDPQAPGAQPSQWAVDQVGNALAQQSEAILTGPNLGIEVDKDGDVFYAEHSGSALSSSSKELSDIETRGAAQGLAMLQRDTRAAQTAESERLQRNEKDASLASAARSLEDAAEIALAFTALFMGLPDGGTISIDREFTDTILDTPRMQAFIQATAAGQFTLETFWDILIRGGALPPDFDKVAERDALEQQGRVTLVPPPGTTLPTSTSSADTGSGDTGDGAGAAGDA
jgi:hypothetical protein